MDKYSDVDKGKSLMKDFKEEISERQEKNHEKVLLWSLREKRVSKKSGHSCPMQSKVTRRFIFSGVSVYKHVSLFKKTL